MTLYHGSNIAIPNPDLSHSRSELDFGAGFYATTNLQQAIDFSRKIMRKRTPQQGWVSAYEIDDQELNRLNILHFDSPDSASNKALSLLHFKESINTEEK
jgi:hypothetical protein